MATLAVSGRSAQRDNRARRMTRWFYWCISPWLIGFVLLTVIPLLAGLALSFTNYDGMNLASVKWLGFANYLRALNDNNARYALGRTLLFAALNVPLSLLISFGLALLLTQQLRARGLFRTLFYLPSIIPIVAVAWIWKLMADQNFGLLNGLLGMFRPGTAIGWLTDYPTQVLLLMSLWMSAGGAMVIFLAGLQSVPKDLEEAARIDGATTVQMFRAITLPLMTPVIFYQLVLSIIFSLQVLVEPILLGGSGQGTGLSALPPRPNYLYMVHTYNQIFGNQRFGYGSALLWLLFVLTLLLTILIFRTSRYWVYYETNQEGSGA